MTFQAETVSEHRMFCWDFRNGGTKMPDYKNGNLSGI